MAEDIVKLLVRSGNHITLVFFVPQRRYPIPRDPLQRGHKIHGVGKLLRFSTEISIYLGNGRR